MATTGVAYDPAMANYHCLWDPSYVENPDRWLSVFARCQSLGLIQRCSRIPSRPATRQELELCHSPDLLEILESTATMDTDQLKAASSQYDCLYIHPDTWQAALLSAGGAVDLVKAVVAGEMKNGMGILRPPGHHATREEACGYCYVNNVAIAARVALSQGVGKVLIVDWDVHHGQGTQREFYGDSRVMYVSIHRYEHGGWWPNLRESEYDHIGEGNGVGYNVNIPLNVTGNTDADYLSAWHNIVLPVAKEFNPDLVLISAGFDPAVGCPEGEQEVTPACFAHLAHSLMGFAGGRVVALLEGGYFAPSLAEGAALTMRSLLGDPCPLLEPLGGVSQEMKTTIDNVRITLGSHWKCFEAWKDNVPVDPVWKGPDHPDSAPFDIMCPTPPRSPEIENHFKALVKKLVENTDLSVPKFGLGVTRSVPRDCFTETAVMGEDVVEKFLDGEILSAIVDPSNAPLMWNLLSSITHTILFVSFEVDIEKEEFPTPSLVSARRIILDPDSLKNIHDYDAHKANRNKSTRISVPMWKINSDDLFLNILHMGIVPISYGLRQQVLLIRGLDNCPHHLKEYTRHALGSTACNRVIVLC